MKSKDKQHLMIAIQAGQIAFILSLSFFNIKQNNEVNTLKNQLMIAEQQLQEYKSSDIANDVKEYNQGISLIEMIYILNSLESSDKDVISYDSIKTMISRDSTVEGDINSGDFKVYYSVQGDKNVLFELVFKESNMTKASLIVTYGEDKHITKELTNELIQGLIDNIIIDNDNTLGVYPEGAISKYIKETVQGV